MNPLFSILALGFAFAGASSIGDGCGGDGFVRVNGNCYKILDSTTWVNISKLFSYTFFNNVQIIKSFQNDATNPDTCGAEGAMMVTGEDPQEMRDVAAAFDISVAVIL